MLRNYHKDINKTCFYRDVIDNIKYYTDIDGNVFKIENGEVSVITPKFIDGQKFVYIESLGKMIRVANIVNYSFKGKYQDVFDELMEQQIIFLDGNVSNIHPSNMIWGNANSKDDKEGFRIIPGFVQYRINRQGIIKTPRGGLLKGRLTEGSSSPGAKTYLKLNLKADVSGKLRNGKEYPYILIAVHRLLALAYLPIPVNFYNMDVSHINDNSLDNRIENLEWVSRSANNNRALENNLIAGTNPVLIRNFDTGEVTKFISIGQCARFFSLHKTKITNFCKTKGQKVFPNGYQFCREDEFTEWGMEPYDYSNDNASKWQNSIKRNAVETLLGIRLPLSIYDEKTGESYLIEEYTELKRFFGLLPGYKIFK
nr:MAG TPA: homing endonuclease [Caudoviricetes sp.]